MKRAHSFTLLFIMFSAVLAFTACSTGVDSMVDNYNEGFSAITNQKLVSTGISIYDPDFKAENMLSARYTVDTLDTLCLWGPNDASKYQWKAVMTDGSEEVFDAENPATVDLGTNQALIEYLPTSGLSKWAKYTLTLTVSDADGNEYSDSALLVVF